MAKFINHYRCPHCGCTWQSPWDAVCNDQCPRCDRKDISPFNSDDVVGQPAPSWRSNLSPLLRQTATKHQEDVADFMLERRWYWWTPHQILTQMVAEVGELGDVVNALFGPKPPKPGETPDEELEVGDIYYALICYANSRGISLNTALSRSMRKFETRDKDRFNRKEPKRGKRSKAGRKRRASVR